MANRTSMLVLAAAVTMLIASFSLQSEVALAEDDEAAAIAEIAVIKTAAWSAMDETVATTISEIGGAVKVGEATSATNAGLNAIDSIYWAAAEDLVVVAEEALWADPVEAAALDAAGALEGRAAQANAQINDAYDAWLAANWEYTAEDIIADIEWWVEHGIGRLDDIVAEYADDLEDADSTAEAAGLRDEALAGVARSVGQTITKLDNELARMPNDPAVQAAHAQALAESEAAGGLAESAVTQLFDAFVDTEPPVTTTTTTTAPPATTTTTAQPPTTTPPPVSTTTTSAPQATTTTTTPAPTTTTSTPPTTTTTTMPAAAQLPPTDPPMSEFMAELPAPVVRSATAASSAVLRDQTSMAMVGLVRRVVDSQLPAGVSTVAAGPLVVLGLIIDAIRAAGALMAVPWLLLGVYVAGLLRPRRTPLPAGLGAPVAEMKS